LKKNKISTSFTCDSETSNNTDNFYEQHKKYFENKSNAIAFILDDFFERGSKISKKSLKKIGLKKNLIKEDIGVNESEIFDKISKIERVLNHLSKFSLPRLEVCKLLFPVFNQGDILDFLEFEEDYFAKNNSSSKLFSLLEEIKNNPSKEMDVSILRIEKALNEFIKVSLPRLEVLQFVFTALNDDDNDFKMFSDKVLNKHFYR